MLANRSFSPHNIFTLGTLILLFHANASSSSLDGAAHETGPLLTLNQRLSRGDIDVLLAGIWWENPIISKHPILQGIEHDQD